MENDRGRNQLREALGRTDACPDIEDLVTALERGDRQLQTHSDACAYCRTQIALFYEFIDATPSPEEARDVRWVTRQLHTSRGTVHQDAEPRISWWERWTSPRALVPLGLAFASLLVIVTVVSSRNGSLSGPPHVSENQILRSSSFDLIQPEGELSEAPGELQWTPVAGAASYQAEVLEVDGNPLWTVTTSGTWVAIPSEVRKRIVPGKRLVWRVSARRADGSELVTSEKKAFSIRLSGDIK